MQSTAFAPFGRAADYQLRDHDKIPQFEQVSADAEVAVEIPDLLMQQVQSVCRSL